MSTVAKLASMFTLSAVLVGTVLTPAYALRMPVNDENEATREKSVSAYAGDDKSESSSEPSILTPDEIRHIRWCAGRYTMEYDAVSDTYSAAGGIRQRCRSPR